MSTADAVVRWLCRPNIPLFGQPLGAFRLHPDVLLGILMLVGLYLIAHSMLHKRSGITADQRHRKYLYLAIITLLIAEVSPLHDLAEGYLLTAHMVQHFLLVYLLPPFLLLSIPEGMLQPLVRGRKSMAVAKLLTHPVFAIFMGNAIYAAWHVPVAYQAALLWHEIHILEHILMVGSAILMWWPIFSPMKELPRLPAPGQIIYLFLMSAAQMGVFAYVTFTDGVLYRFYSTAPRIWGITAEVDQVISGVIMKLGMFAVITAVLTITFFRWARSNEPAGTRA